MKPQFNKPTQLAVLVGGVMAASMTLANAQLLSSESFSGYNPGTRLPADLPSPTVSGYNGDWSAVAFGTAQASTFAGSLTYANPLYAAGVGNRAGTPADNAGIGAGNSGRASRLLDGSLAATDASAGTLYLSWLYQNGNENAAAQPDVYHTLALYNGDAGNDGNRTFDAGISAGDFATPDFGFRVNNSASLRSSLGVARDANVHLFVARISLSSAAGGDSVTMWLDPTLGAGDPAGGVTFSGFDLRYDRLAISDYASNSSMWDEIRWGGTFNDVTITAVPEPGTASFIALGLAGLVLRKRQFSRG